MAKFVKEPLVHFLLMGAALFVLYSWMNPGGVEEGDKTIVVSKGRIEQLIRIFEKTWQRPPTADELKGLIDDFVIEELYYRQGVAMGIDKDDTLIRRRMRQKVEFLTDDTAAMMDPSEEELGKYLSANQEKFRKDSLYSFRQVYINPEKHKTDLDKYVKEILEKLRAGQEVRGDSALLAEVFQEASGREIDGALGIGFADKLDSLSLEKWSEPLQSGLGIHLVFLKERRKGKVPSLDELRTVVKREWENEMRQQLRKEFNDRLLEEYEVVIDWPEVETEKEGKKE